jgi:FKBP-type peptidyl-prolyl cis-trans isomerase FkpA
MQRLIIPMLFILAVAAACNNKDKFFYTPNGYPFKYHINNEGESPKSGDEVQFRLYVRNQDTVISRSFETEAGIKPYSSIILPGELKTALPPHIDALSILSPGDSITLYYKIDTLQRKPTGFENSEFIYYDLVLVDYKKPEPKKVKQAKPLPITDFEVSPRGYPVKFHVNKEGTPPKIGEYIHFKMYIRNDKEVVFSTEKNKTGNETFKVARFELPEPVSPQMDAFSIMSPGDSLTLYFQIDTLENKPKNFENSDMVYYDLVLLDVLSPAEHSKVQVEKERAQQEEQKKVRARGPQVEKELKSIVSQYKRGELNMKIRTATNGLKFMILQPGEGNNIESSKYVKHHYYCMLPDGTALDSSFPDGAPFEILIGERKVITGLEQGMLLLKNKSKAVFFIPPALAYGAEGITGKVPPNTEIIYYVEVTEVK